MGGRGLTTRRRSADRAVPHQLGPAPQEVRRGPLLVDAAARDDLAADLLAESPLGDVVRAGAVAIWSAVAAVVVAWLLAAVDALDAEGVVMTWSVILLAGVVAMSLLVLRGFIHGNRAAKAAASVS